MLEFGEVEFGAFPYTRVGEVRRLRARALDEEESGQGQRSVGAVVIAEDDARPGGTGAQVFADDPVLFGVGGPGPGPADIADEAALVEPGTRGLGRDVEAQPLVRGEDRGDAVEQGGLARTRGSGDEVALVGDGDAVDVGVEGAPVGDLDLTQPPLTADIGTVRPTGSRLIGDEGRIEREECLGHASPSSGSAVVSESEPGSVSASSSAPSSASVSVSATASPRSSPASVSPAAMRS